MARTIRHLVVDGSNIATESRTLPSLAQLDEAVRAVQAEDPDWQVTVIVDATFSHRIDASERKMFEDANNAGEIITPPAGAVGRGDAFILQVAEKAGAAVLSNDSFQEFHGEHPWLFEEGRLIGGKPVGDLGWVFVPRVPVRGPASRRATRGGRDTKKSGGSSRGSSKRGSDRAARADSGSGRAARADSGSGRAARVKGPAPKPTAATPPPAAKKDRRGSGDKTDRRQKDRRGKTTDEAKPRTAAKKSAATDKKGRAEPGGSGRTKQTKKDGGADRSSSKQNVQELNSPRDFMLFVTQHSIGDEVTAVVDRFSSHGCYLRASSAQCYLPSSAMGDPPPSRARDVVSLGQTIIARVESLDSDRRGINVVLVRTITDDSNGAVSGERDKQGTASAGKSRGSKQGRTSQQLQPVADESAREENLTRSKPTVATKKTAKKASKRPAAKKATKKRAAKATKSARASKAAARKATKKAAPKKAAAKKATAKKAAKKRPAAKKAAKKATKKAAPKKAAKKRPAAKKAAKKATKKAAPKKAAKKRPAAKKAAKKATKKAAPRKAAKKRPAAKKATKKAAPRKAAKKATKKAAKKR